MSPSPSPAAAPQWTASVLPGANWLTVSPLSGTESGPLKITVNAAGLSRGAYKGIVSVQAGDAIPQAIHIPVTFVVGTSESTVITAVANGASYAQAFAPGMLMTVFGTELSPGHPFRRRAAAAAGHRRSFRHRQRCQRAALLRVARTDQRAGSL